MSVIIRLDEIDTADTNWNMASSKWGKLVIYVGLVLQIIFPNYRVAVRLRVILNIVSRDPSMSSGLQSVILPLCFFIWVCIMRRKIDFLRCFLPWYATFGQRMSRGPPVANPSRHLWMQYSVADATWLVQGRLLFCAVRISWNSSLVVTLSISV